MKLIATGKIRKVFDLEDGRLVIVTSDRISAYDKTLPNLVESKGEILNRLSAFWSEKTQHIIPNHMISINNSDMPKYFQKPEFQGRCMLVHKLKMLPIECIVRGYITGSSWTSYQRTGSVFGISMPCGLQESQKLPDPLYTPTTKAISGHDEPITVNQTIKMFGTTALSLRNLSISIYNECAEYARANGIIIADTKFEFGIDCSGNILLADEVLTPDSSRFWPADSYEVGHSQQSFDKQFVRDWLKEHNWTGGSTPPVLPYEIIAATSQKYIEVYEKLTKQTFTFE